MAQKYEFEQIESDGQQYVIANPVNQTAEPVRLSAHWIEGGDVEGEWERAVRAVIKNDLLGSMELKEGNGRIDRRQAIETLAEASDDEGDIVTSEQQAEALLEYFASEDIIELEGGQLVMLRNPNDTDNVNGKMILNWSAAIDACVEQITETIDRIENAKEKLENRIDDVDQDSAQINENLRETAQELKSLGDGQDVPQDPSQLSEEERNRFQQLKRKLIYHKKMKEVEDKNPAETVKQGASHLGDKIAMLKDARTVLANKREQFRTIAMEKQILPDDAMNIVNNMGELATQLVGVKGIDETVENTDDAELASIVDDIAGDVDGLTETTQQMTEEETTEDKATDLGMS